MKSLFLYRMKSLFPYLAITAVVLAPTLLLETFKSVASMKAPALFAEWTGKEAAPTPAVSSAAEKAVPSLLAKLTGKKTVAGIVGKPPAIPEGSTPTQSVITRMMINMQKNFSFFRTMTTKHFQKIEATLNKKEATLNKKNETLDTSQKYVSIFGSVFGLLLTYHFGVRKNKEDIEAIVQATLLAKSGETTNS